MPLHTKCPTHLRSSHNSLTASKFQSSTMRIRKNAKTSTLASAFLPPISNSFSTPNHHKTTLCLLNQSPWDIITFPSIHPFDDFVTRYYVNLPANWSSAGSGGAIQSVDSTRNSFEYDIVNRNRNRNVDEEVKDYELYEEEKELGFTKGCVKKGDNVVDPQNDAVWSTNKKAQPHVSRSRGAKKRAIGVTPKQNEFYYYSGFGPSWGKKRGGLGGKCTSFDACGTTNIRSGVHETIGDMDVEEDEKCAEPDMTMETVWSCQVTSESEDFNDVGEDEQDSGKQKKKTVKKRGRKPIKARSLKSLM